MPPSFNVLFSRELTENQLNKLIFPIDSFAFITIKYLDFYLPPPSTSHRLIFTSKNAVEAVLSQHKIATTQPIYAVGEKTKQKALQYAAFQNIKTPDTQENTEALIKLLEKEKSNNFLYFCGKKRLPYLEQYFNQKKKQYKAIEVYDTLLSPPSGLNTANYQWLCFCSPTAVASYLKKYTILPFHKMLCIGKTTAAILQKHTANVTVAPKASVESMLNYLKQQYEKQ